METLVDTADSQGGAGELLTDYSSLRSDAITVVKMLSLGVVDEETTRVVLRRAYLKAGQAKSARNYKAAMSVILAAASLDQKERLARMAAGNQAAVSVNVAVGVGVQAGIGQEPEYLEWKREQFRRRSGDTSNVGSNGFAATVLDAPSRLGDGQGGNGHASGG